MMAKPETFLKDWHRIVAEKDLVALEHVLAEDIEIGAPPYWGKLQGRRLVHYLLGLIVTTVEDFTYHREWWDGSEYALEFTGRIEGSELQGIDLITLNSSSQIRNIDVLMRPVNAIITLRDLISPQMATFLSQGSDQVRP